MRVLLDTNVILDIALERQPFYAAAAKILQASDFLDFEDAVQNAAAIDCRIDAIITRNKADYRTSPLTVLAPEEFAAAHLV